MDTRTCTECKTEKSIEDFSLTDSKRGYRRYKCKTCYVIYSRILSSKDPNYHKKQRGHRLKREFGITLEQYEEMLKRQNGVCAICKNKCATHKNLSVDHDHKTGQVRQLLCFHCNTGLGHLRDDIELLQEAINYLTSWQT